MSENQPTIPVEAIAAFPPPGLGIPDAFTFSLDSRHLMYLYGEGNAQQRLYVLDIATGEKRVLLEPPDGGTQEDNLSPEEELRRQRLRMLSVGITQFERAETSNRLLLPLSGNLYVFDSDTNQLRQVLDGSDQPSVQNPTLSKDGSQIAFVQDAEICTLSAEGGQPRQTTSGARGRICAPGA